MSLNLGTVAVDRPPPAGLRPNGLHLGPGPIEGHEKGLDLSPEDRTALIAFIKIL